MKNKRRRTFEEIKPVLEKIKEHLLHRYDDRALAIILYGSFVKGVADEDSDIDIAIILKGKVDKGKEIDEIYAFLYEIEVESGELISVNPLSQEEIENSRWPLYLHIKKDGIPL